MKEKSTIFLRPDFLSKWAVLTLFLLLHLQAKPIICSVVDIPNPVVAINYSGSSQTFNIIMSGTTCTAYFKNVPSWLHVSKVSGSTYSAYADNNSTGNIRTAVVGIAATSSGSTVGYMDFEQAAAPFLNVSPSSMSFIASGGMQSASVSSNTSWSVSSFSGCVSSASRSGDKVNVSCGNNSSSNSQPGSVTITGGGVSAIISVSQQGAVLYLSFTQSSYTFAWNAVAHDGSLSISTNASSLSVSSGTPPSWLSIGSPSSSSVVVTCMQANNLPGTRSYTLSIQAGSLTTSMVIYQTGAPLPGTPSTPAVSNSCGQSVLSFNGSPPSGTSWYWQTSSNGTSTSNSSSSMTVYSASTQYLRAKSNETGLWSSSSSSGTAGPYTIPSTPNTPTVSNDCGQSVLSFNGTPPSGVNWYWQSSASGTSTSNSSSSWTVTSSGSYYLRARSTNGCWSSSSSSGTAGPYTIPSTPNTPTVSNDCGQSVLSFNGTPPSGVNWYWQSSASGTSTSNSSSSWTVTSSGSYYLRARSTNGCWSSSSSSGTAGPYTIPSTPNTPTVSNDCGQSVLSFNGTPPSGVNWYWQSSASGTSTSNSSSSWTVTSSGSYYLRARSTNGCWSSSSSSGTAGPYTIPSTPNTPTVSNDCGQSVLSFNGTPPSGVNWYWQSSASGTSTSNSSSSWTVTSSGSYYLRARSTNGCWSSSSSSGTAGPYTIPSTPNTPTVSNDCGQSVLSFNGTPPSGVNWYWQSSASGTSTSNSSSSWTVTSSGSYYLRARSTNGCWSSSSSSGTAGPYTPPTTASVGLTQNICSTLLSESLGGNTPAIGTGLWSQVSGPGTTIFSAFSSGTSKATATVYGTYVYRWTINNGTCTASTADVTVNFNSLSAAPTSITSNMNHVCPEETFTLLFNGGTLGTGASWEWYDNASFTNALGSSSTLMASCTENTTYYVRAEGSCNTTAAVSLTIVVDTITPGEIFLADTLSYQPIVNKTITSVIDATAGHCGFAYSWQKALAPKEKTNPLVWEDISGETSKSLLIESLDVSTFFKRGAKDTKDHLAYTDSILIQIIDTLIVPPSDLLVNGTTLTVHKGRYGKNGEWAWYSDFKGQPLETATDSVLNVNVSRSTRFRARAEYTVKNEADEDIPMKTYFVSNKIQVPETINLSSDQNYIVSYTPVSLNGVDENGLTSLPLEEQGAVVQYFDGLGRPTQTVAANQSYFFNDVIVGVGYDDFGRQDKTYLPFTNPENGTFADNHESLISSFYNQAAHNEVDGLPILFKDSENADRIASLTVYEPSPLNRVTSTIDPAGGKTTYLYGTNASGEVILWNVNEDGDCERESTSSTYAANELYKTQTNDQEEKTVIEYKDKQGQVVLKVADTEKTYYVYDDFGLLRYVISPKATEAITNASLTTLPSDNEIIKGLCYYYQYDGRKRMVEKQLPGADPVLMVYDTRDRLILTQDGKTREEDKLLSSKRWMYTKYDDLNRPTETGWMETTDIWETLQNTFTNIIGYSSYPGETSLTKTHYDNYTGYPGTLPTTYNSAVKGLVTWQESVWLSDTESGNVITANFYDDKYRVIQSKVTGSPIEQVTTNTYDFVGKLLTSTETYSWEGVNQTVHKYYTYDHAGRLEKVEQEIDGDTQNGRVVLAQNDYNELGQLVLKKLHMANDISYVQDIDYRYDIRGWLKSINNYSDASFRKLFAEDLSYNANGNINTMNWENTLLDDNNNPANPNKQTYAFTYDGLNRLLTAGYSDTDPATQADFSTWYSYYPNGNFHTLKRQGNKNNALAPTPSYDLIDDLTYNYPDFSNKVSSVNDDVTSGVSNPSQYPYNTGSYSYDANGNAIFIPNKNLGITYNYLNLPKTIGTITYLYDATGNKLKKTFGGVDSYYQGSVLKINEKPIILTGEGRVVNNDGVWSYEYDLKDHLGNTRISFSADNAKVSVLQTKDYYPFGLEMTNNISTVGDPTKYLYNGKEMQDEGDLDWYDYGARFYDPALGRLHTVDPLAEKYSFHSPYAYAANNPILFIDWLGMEPKIKGPYSGRTHVRNNGTVVVYRVTTGQRVMANTTKQAIFSAGWLGVGVSMYDAIRGFDAKEIGGSLRGGFFQFGEDLSKTAADDAVVGINQGLFAKSALGFGLFGKSLGAYQIGKAIADDTPTQSEALHSAAFNLTKKFQGGNINIANSALMEFTNGENPESVENHMNAIYNTLEQNLSGFDLTTNKGVREANKYLNDNLNQVVKQINQMLKDDDDE